MRTISETQKRECRDGKERGQALSGDEGRRKEAAHKGFAPARSVPDGREMAKNGGLQKQASVVNLGE